MELFSQIPVPRSARGCLQARSLLFLRRSLLTWIFLPVLPLLPNDVRVQVPGYRISLSQPPPLGDAASGWVTYLTKMS